MIPLTDYKVVYGEIVLKALALMHMNFPENANPDDFVIKPKIIDVLVINLDGNIEIIRDESWRFRFIKELKKKRNVDLCE